MLWKRLNWKESSLPANYVWTHSKKKSLFSTSHRNYKFSLGFCVFFSFVQRLETLLLSTKLNLSFFMRYWKYFMCATKKKPHRYSLQCKLLLKVEIFSMWWEMFHRNPYKLFQENVNSSLFFHTLPLFLYLCFHIFWLHIEKFSHSSEQSLSELTKSTYH